MTQEEKAKRYDEAIERAKKVLLDCTSEEQKVVEYITPELKESEDERISKHLLYHFRNKTKKEWNGMPVKDILAWIEEQEQHKKFRDSIQVGDKVTKNEDGVLVNLSQLKRVAKKDEKQDKKKPVDKVEPKFKVGDWVAYDGWHCQITEVREDGYCNSMNGFIPKEREDSMHLIITEPAEWSEEDKMKINDVIVALSEYANGNIPNILPSILLERVDWLKSLRPPYYCDNCKLKKSIQGWKPSDEQIFELGCVVKQNKDNMLGKNLQSLLDDLKKLKEE